MSSPPSTLYSPNQSSYKVSPRLNSVQSINISSPRLRSISISGNNNSSAQSPHSSAHRRKLSNVNANQPPQHTITIASRDNLSKSAQLLVSILRIRDVAYIDGDKLTVDHIDDPVQALLYLGKKLHNKSTNTLLLDSTTITDVSTQQSEYWVNICNGTINSDILLRANKQLNTSTYLVDRYLTAADVVFYVAVHTSILQFGKDDREKYSNLVRWYVIIVYMCIVTHFLGTNVIDDVTEESAVEDSID